jgi:hypothetical protein
MADEPIAGDSFFDRLPLPVSRGLTAEQRAAIADAVVAGGKNSPPVNIRLGIPLPFGRWFVSVLAGRERRSRERIVRDRTAQPLKTLGNAAFVFAGMMILYLVAALAVLLYTSAIEF